MYTLSATVKTDLKPMPFSPAYAGTRVSGTGEPRQGTERTNEPAWVIFTWFGAPANVAYSLDIGSPKAKLVALEYDEAVLDPKAEGGDGVSPVRVVICVLNDL